MRGKAGLIAPYRPGSATRATGCVSSTGALKLCLFGEREIPLRPYLQSDDRRRELVALIASSVQAKAAVAPPAGGILRCDDDARVHRRLSGLSEGMHVGTHEGGR